MRSSSPEPAQPVVWVFVHDLTRTGTPVVLDRMLRALPVARSTVHIVALRGGPIERPLRGSVASLTVMEPLDRRSVPDALAVGLETIGIAPRAAGVRRTAYRRRCRALPSPDVVVVHGAGAWPLTSIVADHVPLVVHLHELDTALDRCIAPSAQRGAFERARRVLAVSGPVADLAIARGAAAAAVDLVPGVVDFGQHDSPAYRLRAESGQVGAVMGAGVPGWRKGTDRLAAVAHELDRLGHSVGVGWVGGRPSGVDAPWVEAPDPVGWFPVMEDPWQVLRSAQVIVVPSREDPLPLVALEAGLRRRAVVAMATGGLPDLLSDGRGVAVEDQNVGRFIAEVAALLDEPTRAAETGEALHAHVLAHHDVAVVAPMWWDLVLDASGC